MGVIKRDRGIVVGDRYRVSGVGRLTTLTLAATGNQVVDASRNSFFTISPTASLTLTPANTHIGQEITINIRQTTTTAHVITFGTGFRSVGTLTMGTVANNVFIIRFIATPDGIVEISRTAAISIV